MASNIGFDLSKELLQGTWKIYLNFHIHRILPHFGRNKMFNPKGFS